jgi:polyhydroxybutyrate depolymerase
MTNRSRWSSAWCFVIGGLALSLVACGSSTGGGDHGSGGAGAGPAATGGRDGSSGGTIGSGGSGSSAGTGGVVAGTGGGLPSSGGRSGSSGGATGGSSIGTGGSVGTGGSIGTGGVGTGGRGGTPGTGGRAGSGGGAGGNGGGRGGTTGGAGSGTAGASGALCPSTATAAPGNVTKMVMSGSMNRSYVLHVPPSYTGKTPVPVVFDFHGLGGTGMSQMSTSNWRAVADAQGFIMVYPNGVGNSWNMGRCCNPAQQQNVDDVGFVRAMINQLKTDACIDAKRVYSTGCSNGGGMSYKLACDAADVIAAVAPVDCDCVTGSTSNPSCAMCAPSRPITEIAFRGTGDTIVPYGGGETPVVAGLVFPGAQSNFTNWGQINMCTGTPQPLPNHAACQTYPMCGAGAETTLCVVQNGSHCGSYGSFNIANIAWETMQKHTLP